VRVLLTNKPINAKAPAASSVLGASDLVQGYMTYSVGTRNIFDLAKICWKVRRLQAKTLIYLAAPRGESAIRRDEMFFRLCGVKEIIGIPHGEFATHRYDPATDLYEAEASRLARCVANLGDARLYDRTSWDLRLTGDEKSRAALALGPLNGQPYVTLGIASKKSVTDWGTANWKELMPRLWTKFANHALVFIGAKEDRSAASEVSIGWLGASLNLSGDLSPRESAAVIQGAEVFIGLDSGPLHLAASVGTPCVAISAAHKRPGVWFPFGDSHEVIYHKTECFGCNLEVCTIEQKKCILSISVDEVVAAAVRASQRRKGHYYHNR